MTLTQLVREVVQAQGVHGQELQETVCSEASKLGLDFTETEIRFAVGMVEESGASNGTI